MLAMQSEVIDSVTGPRACAWGVVGCCSILPRQLSRPLTVATTNVPDRSPNPNTHRPGFWYSYHPKASGSITIYPPWQLKATGGQFHTDFLIGFMDTACHPPELAAKVCLRPLQVCIVLQMGLKINPGAIEHFFIPKDPPFGAQH